MISLRYIVALLLVIGVVAVATDHKYHFTGDRMSSRALEPPFQPPIEVSV